MTQQCSQIVEFVRTCNTRKHNTNYFLYPIKKLFCWEINTWDSLRRSLYVCLVLTIPSTGSTSNKSEVGVLLWLKKGITDNDLYAHFCVGYITIMPHKIVWGLNNDLFKPPSKWDNRVRKVLSIRKFVDKFDAFMDYPACASDSFQIDYMTMCTNFYHRSWFGVILFPFG